MDPFSIPRGVQKFKWITLEDADPVSNKGRVVAWIVSQAEPFVMTVWRHFAGRPPTLRFSMLKRPLGALVLFG